MVEAEEAVIETEVKRALKVSALVLCQSLFSSWYAFPFTTETWDG